jgi:uncharacterized membrane protein
MNTLGKLFLQGLAVIIPVTLTLAILWWMARGAEQFLGGILMQILPPGWYLPGLGVASAVIITGFIGLMTHILLFQKLFAIPDTIFKRLPLVKTIYSAFKDFVDYLNPESKVGMSKVVLVKLPGQQYEMLGFVTREDFSRLPFELNVEQAIAVYLPMSYMVGGYTLFLPRSCLTPVDMSFEDGMKLVLTGAVSQDASPAPALDSDKEDQNET